VDNDRRRAELDGDTDNGGVADGYEDLNLDGDVDAVFSESDPFDAAQGHDPEVPRRNYFCEGTASAVAGLDGAQPRGSLELDTMNKTFRWRSADKVLGDFDTRAMTRATLFQVTGDNPQRVVFSGTAAGAAFRGDVLLGTYLRAVVDVTRYGRHVRYLVKGKLCQ
jgi:hypothetical protein